MGGAEPPEDFHQAEAYFSIAFRRLLAAHGEDWERDAHLVAGAAPDMLWGRWQTALNRTTITDLAAAGSHP